MRSTAPTEAFEPDNNSASARSRTPIAGVGASSGGLEAFTNLLRPLPADSGMALVLIQHLERKHPSSLAEILQASTPLPVKEAGDGMIVEPNHIYVIPPESDLTIANGKLKLEQRGERSAAHFPIDQFFRSLAVEMGNLAVGIVLSGSGTDGTQGLLAIKEACGVTFAQDEATAQTPAMPQSAVAAGAVDFVLNPSDITLELLKLGAQSRNAPTTNGSGADSEWETAGSPDLEKIFGLLHKATKIDFTHYKRKTVNRRIARRMVVQDQKTLSGYHQYLENNPGEITKLFREILINVTSFFREPASFDNLMERWREKIRERPPHQGIRAWVAACATGEEVYSIAICLAELFGDSEFKCPMQVFGTDVNELALETARAGIYPENIASDISPERLSRFFNKVDRGYQVHKAIRECCVFARHDLTRDPPFSRLDLVSCRNVLIYLGPVLQKRIIPMFHYSLKPGAYLMLGSAEAIAGNSDLFEVVDKQNRLFVRQSGPTRFTPDFKTRSEQGEELLLGREVDIADLEMLALRAIRDRFATDGVVINREMRIVLFRGRTNFYIDPAPGTPSFHLLRMVREDLIFKVESMVSRAVHQNIAVRETGISTGEDSRRRRVDIEVIPLRLSTEGEAYYLVTFASHPEPDSASVTFAKQSEDERFLEYDRELSDARSHLRALAEEHEVNLEEIRAANEEVQSTNEELQSTNEELGTAKEELQSTNEELTIINEELSTKNGHLATLNDDLNNLFNGASLPILMVDGNLRLRRFTPAAESFLSLNSFDIGRTMTEIRLPVEVPGFKELLDQTVADLTVSTLSVLAGNGRWYTVTMRPYRTADNRIDGAVITFTDINSLKRSLDDAEDSRLYSESILETLWEPLLVLDSQMRVQRATPGFYRAFQVSKEETEGRFFYDLGNGQWNNNRLRQLLEDILPRDTSFEDFELETFFPKIGFRSMRLNARRIYQRGDGRNAILIAINDVTERREAAEIRYRRLFETAKDGILELDGDSGDILDVNPFFLQMVNSSRAELIGKKLWQTNLFDSDVRLRELVNDTRRKDSVRFESMVIRARDGKRFQVELICNRYMVSDEAVIQCNVRDVTERRRAEEELRRSNEDLQQFAYAASHDLQEPLRMVGAYTQLLGKKYRPLVDEEGGKFLDVIASSVRRMEQLIKDLLVYSQTTVHESRPTPVNSEKVLGLALMNLQLAISDTGAIITNDALPTVRMDQIHFVQVFQNLISNAIKYRQRDVAPVIHLAAKRDGSDWVFSVEDNGLGFDEQYADQIFGVFKRLHGKDYPGTGIGLSICKKIIEREGGRIWVRSAVGVGSTFFFTVPDGIPER